MNTSPDLSLPTTPFTLAVSIRRVVALSAVAGCVEVTGYMDCSSIYPGIMTGNTVQLGLTSATQAWARFDIIALAVAAFFVGGIVASVIRRHLRQPAFELLVMAAILAAVSAVRWNTALRIPIELPLLAMAMAIQGETLSKFGGVSIQTIVVTNSMVKFTDALTGRYLARGTEVPSLDEVLLPGSAWLTYSLAAGAGALAAGYFRLPLMIPILLLIGVAVDLLRRDRAPAAFAVKPGV
jgi:uncharacterized membrane protein YoaK (UPF0700 family)